MLGVLDFYAAHPFWTWAALGAAILAVEVAAGSGWLLWPAASAVATGAVLIVAPLSLPMALLVFAVLTLVSTLAARRYFPRAALAGGGDINDNVARLVGQVGQAVQDFHHGRGRIAIDGKEWPAELQAGESLSAGGAVEVVGISDGTRLQVRPSQR